MWLLLVRWGNNIGGGGGGIPKKGLFGFFLTWPLEFCSLVFCLSKTWAPSHAGKANGKEGPFISRPASNIHLP